MNKTPDSLVLTNTADRIRARWGARGVTLTLAGDNCASQPLARTMQTLYSATTVTHATADFLGDWRTVDAWLRKDLKPARDRSRQLERGNPWCQSFKSSLLNNVLGAFGFKFRPNVVYSAQFGDTGKEGEPDKLANAKIVSARKKFERQENFTTGKMLTRKQCDRLALQRLAFDGEFIMRKIRGFDNAFKFAWQVVDPDFLDENLNKVTDDGNLIKMGVEFDRIWKFPVAYWFLTRRTNDYIFDRTGMNTGDKHRRVLADEVIHVFIQEYPEQARGIPWPFAAIVNLQMIGAYEEAALINARVGANKMGFFKKTTPTGFEGDAKNRDDHGKIIDFSEPGSWTELPWDVEPVDWSPNYPDAEFDPFNKAMLRSISAALKMSYMTLSNDLSQANFSSLRAGLNEEREQWMSVQEFLIEKWKDPEFDEWIYRAIVSGELNLPIGKIDKFNAPVFTGRRWPFVNPVQDWQAKQLALDMRAISLTSIIEESGGDREEVFNQIERDEKELSSRGIQRIHSTFQIVDMEPEDPNKKAGDGDIPDAGKKSEASGSLKNAKKIN